MTRKEEIIKAAEKSVLGYHPAIQKMCTECFIEGAEWSDANPDKKHVYTKRELMDMKFAFTLNGDIVTPDEMRKDLHLLVKHEKEQLLEKIFKWLKDNVENYVYVDTDEGSSEYSIYDGFDVPTMLEDIRKAVEDEYESKS